MSFAVIFSTTPMPPDRTDNEVDICMPMLFVVLAATLLCGYSLVPDTEAPQTVDRCCDTVTCVERDLDVAGHFMTVRIQTMIRPSFTHSMIYHILHGTEVTIDFRMCPTASFRKRNALFLDPNVISFDHGQTLLVEGDGFEAIGAETMALGDETYSMSLTEFANELLSLDCMYQRSTQPGRPDRFYYEMCTRYIIECLPQEKNVTPEVATLHFDYFMSSLDSRQVEYAISEVFLTSPPARNHAVQRQAFIDRLLENWSADQITAFIDIVAESTDRATIAYIKKLEVTRTAFKKRDFAIIDRLLAANLTGVEEARAIIHDMKWLIGMPSYEETLARLIDVIPTTQNVVYPVHADRMFCSVFPSVYEQADDKFRPSIGRIHEELAELCRQLH